ncbi:Aste57867_8639 [Aphanomyces stellatus]|uniref:Aste57867_8639 protein n=1 Tax=Aphanomyces stellatus TaxID=120398 RepID=A0A485KKV4_9STRA|nr:hypothetical protein As57867_008605 [Aphanomyces stellatus]VFT85525.1 Aste57867_8639 [Aphanomyces stellatus]
MSSEKELQRRVYFRNKRRMYRKEEAAARMCLVEQVVTLTAHLSQLECADRRKHTAPSSAKNDSMLAWVHVARALLDDGRLRHAQHKALKAQVKAQRMLVREMKAWVISNGVLHSELGSRVPTWRDWTLPADAAARKLGKEWIIKQMYHNTDRIFMENHFPAIDSGETIDFDMDVDLSAESQTTFLFRSQMVLAMDLDEYQAHFSETIFTLRCYVPSYTRDLPLVVADVEGNTREYGFVTPRHEYVHVLYGEFRTDDRCPLRGVPPATPLDMVRISFELFGISSSHDIHQLPDGRLHRRAFTMQSTSFIDEETPAPWDDDAGDYNVDLSSCPSHLKGLQFFHINRILVEEKLRCAGELDPQ